MRSYPPRSNQSVGGNKAATARIQINVLGKVKPARGETRIREKERGAAEKPQVLLKALIGGGTEDVVEDWIIEDLWLDTLLDGAKRNFRVVLLGLKKLPGHPARPEFTNLSLQRRYTHRTPTWRAAPRQVRQFSGFFSSNPPLGNHRQRLTNRMRVGNNGLARYRVPSF